MLKRSRLGLSAVAATLAVAILSVSLADHSDGHLQDWGQDPGVQEVLQQGLVDGLAISACSAEFPSSTQEAVNRWNAALGFTAFTSVTNCASSSVNVTTAGWSLCSPDSHMCTGISGYQLDPNYAIVNPTTVFVRPNFFPGDGDAHLSRDATHEFGHVLGHADYSGCPGGQATLMDTTEGCFFTTPQTLDINNYAAAYFADAVASLAGSSPSPNNVSLTWSPTLVHNEADFGVFRDGSLIASVARNATSWSGSSQPSGSHVCHNEPYECMVCGVRWILRVRVRSCECTGAPGSCAPARSSLEADGHFGAAFGMDRQLDH